MRIYWPARAERGRRRHPASCFFHGGGWVIGDLDTHDAICRALANGPAAWSSRSTTASRPSTVPGRARGLLRRDTWVAANAAELGRRPARLAVGGDSAGGNLAAAVALMARDRGGPRSCFQLLVYPVTDYAIDTPSYARTRRATS